jgi:hypothetical protein
MESYDCLVRAAELVVPCTWETCWLRCSLRGDMLVPIALTDSELDIVFAAARPLQVADRDPFLRDVAERLAALPERGDGLVFQICREVQRDHWDPPVGIEGKYGTL